MPATLSTKQLLEKRAALHAQNKALLEKAKKEGRDRLNAEETAEWDRREKDIGELTEQIAHADRLETLELRENVLSMSRGVIAGRADSRVPEAADPDTCAIAPSESYRSHLERRGLLQAETPRVGFGQYVRAMVLGPQNDAERRALSEGTDSAGGYTVPDILSADLIDRLRKRATLMRAGATTINLTSDKQFIARIATDAVPAWRAENAAVAESDPTFDRVEFTARALAVLIKVSRELLEDSVNINEAISKVFTGSMALELDRVGLVGSGTPPEPRGIANTSGVGSHSMGTNGAALTSYDPILEVRKILQDANANDMTAAIMAPRTDRTIAGLKDTTNQPLRRPPAIETVPFLATTQIGITDTQGTANNASRIITGDFPECLVGIRNTMRIEVLKERYADFLQYGFLCWLRADVQLAHAASFAQVIGIIP